MSKKVYGIIYKAENETGSKVYIGQTIKSLDIRRKQHTKLNKIMFKWDIIDKAYSKDELDNKEKYWIDYYDSMNPEKGFNRQYGKGHWSPEAIINRKLNYNSNIKWFEDITPYDFDYCYSIDIKEINKNSYYYAYEETCLNKAQLCILKFLVNVIFKNNKKYKIGNKTFAISFIQILEELPYLKNYAHIQDKYYALLFNFGLFDFIEEKTIFTEHNDEYGWINDIWAFSFECGVIKKYRRIHEIFCEFDNDDFIHN